MIRDGDLQEGEFKILWNKLFSLEEPDGPSTSNEIKEVEYNIRAKEALLSGLTNLEMTNVMELQTIHDI